MNIKWRIEEIKYIKRLVYKIGICVYTNDGYFKQKVEWNNIWKCIFIENIKIKNIKKYKIIHWNKDRFYYEKYNII